MPSILKKIPSSEKKGTCLIAMPVYTSAGFSPALRFTDSAPICKRHTHDFTYLAVLLSHRSNRPAFRNCWIYARQFFIYTSTRTIISWPAFCPSCHIEPGHRQPMQEVTTQKMRKIKTKVISPYLGPTLHNVGDRYKTHPASIQRFQKNASFKPHDGTLWEK